MSIHCRVMSDWLELSIRHSVIYDEIIMTYHIHGWSPLCSTKENKRLKFSRLFFYFKWFLGVSCELELGFVYVGLWQKDVALIDDCGRTREIDMTILLAPLNVEGATVHNDS